MMPIYECGREKCPGTDRPHHSTQCPGPPGPPVRQCRYCVGYFPDGDYEVNGDGKCIACLDTRIEEVTECDGCGEAHPLKRYKVEYHDGGNDDEVYYCDVCADLAKMDWNGETKSIAPMAQQEINHG